MLFAVTKYKPNTFIGGIGLDITTKEELALKLAVSISDIKEFKIAGVNVEFYISKNYNIPIDCFSNYDTFTSSFNYYFIDVDGRVQITKTRSFADNSDINFLFPNLITWEEQSNGFSIDGPNNIYLPKCNSTTGIYTFHNWRGGVNRLYIPLLTYLGAEAFFNYKINPSTKKNIIYINPSIASNDKILNAKSKGAIIREVTNFTSPSKIADLSVSKTETTITLIFTTPSSFNVIDFHEIWIKEKEVFDPKTEYLPNDFEITGSNQILTGLKSNTEYIVKLATCDIMYNGSGMSDTPSFSNVVEFRTL